MSDDVKELANAVAEELAVEHCSFYGDKSSKAVKSFFLIQLYRSWGHTAHPGWVLRGKEHGKLFPPGDQSLHWPRALDRALS